MTNSESTHPHPAFGTPLPRTGEGERHGGGDGEGEGNEAGVPSFESDLTGTLEEHWRKGIPTLVLLLLAVFVSGYYYLLVKPGIQLRYSATVQSNLKRLGMEGVNGIGSKINSENSDVELSPQERIKILRETQLSLRRLMGWNPGDDSAHYGYGIVSQALSSSYRREAFSSDDNAAAPYLGLAKTEQQNATGAMERVRKLNKTFAPKASLWLVKGKIEESFAIPTNELLLVEKSVRPLLENESIATTARTLLAQVLVERALRQTSELVSTIRLELLAEADQLLRTVPASNVIALGLQAEAIAIVDTVQGRKVANEGLQQFWSVRETETPSLEAMAAVFRCLLIIESTKEAQIFLSEQLQQISPVDQPRFRALTAAAALRHLVSKAIRVNKEADSANVQKGKVAGASDLVAVLSMAVQLQPESSELLSLLERFAKAGGDDELLVSMKRSIGLTGETNVVVKGLGADGTRSVPAPLEDSVKSFLSAVAGLGAGALDQPSEDALVASVKASPAFGVAASRLAIRMNASGAVSSEVAIRWLKTINDAVPELLVAWSDRANLHLKERQFKEAIECYEFLLVKLPGNEQVAEALEAAKKLE